MAEDPLSPRNPPKTLAERLSQTGSKIADLSKQAATATRGAVTKMADAGKEAVTKTNEAVANAVEAKREQKDERLTQKIEATQAELKAEGIIDPVPAMVTLPEFEEERMALMEEEHNILVDLVEHMHSLSKRIDKLEGTYRALAMEERAKQTEENEASASSNETQPATSQGMTSALSLLGASLVWVVLLTGMDRYITSNAWMVFETYPAEIPVWGIGAGSWVMFVLRQLGRSAPIFRVSTPMLIQTGLAVGITTMMALLLTDDTISTMSSVWTWGTAIAVAVLVSSSLVANAWRSTRNMLRPQEKMELID
jgi:F0F1-type ATP synthase assembly protein I